MGFECDYACVGEVALEKVTCRIATAKEGIQTNYKLILIDYNMPQMMGTEVATRIYKLYEEA